MHKLIGGALLALIGAYWALAELGFQVVADAAEARREERVAREAKEKAAAAKQVENK